MTETIGFVIRAGGEVCQWTETIDKTEVVCCVSWCKATGVVLNFSQCSQQLIVKHHFTHTKLYSLINLFDCAVSDVVSRLISITVLRQAMVS